MAGFSAPWALALVLLAAWLLWRARQPRSLRTHAVSNLFLWQDERVAAPAAGVPDRARPPWLVWLQALALVVLAIAAAGPRRPSLQSDAALVIDVSPSMGARESGGTRLDLARAAARTWLRARPARARISVVIAGSQPIDRGAYRATDAALGAVLDALVPEAAAPDLARAIAAARAATPGPIAVVSDAAPPARADGVSLQWLPVGAPLNNVAIVSLGSGGSGHALIEAQNFGVDPQPVSLALHGSGRQLWYQSFVVGAGSSRAFRPEITAGTTVVTATLHVDQPSGDALDADNARTADVSERAPTRILLVTPGNRFLEQALRALPDVTVDVTPSLPALSGVEGPAVAQTGQRVIVCDRCATAPPRPSLWIPTGSDPAQPEAAVAVRDAGHAVMRGIDFSDARVTPTTMPGNPVTVLATADGRPLITADDSGQGRQVALAADLSQSSLPVTVAFPVFIANAVDWLAARAPAELDRRTVDAMAESDLRQPSSASIETVPATAAPPVHSLLVIIAIVGLLLVAVEISWRRQSALARVAAFIAIVGAIAGVRVPGCTADRTVIFAVDGSGSVASVRRTALDRVRAELTRMPAGDRAGVIVFGERGERLREPDASRALDSIVMPPPSAVTDIAAGILSAQALLPDRGDRRIVLLSDGQPTRGDTLEAAGTVRTPIDVIPLDDRSSPAIRRLDGPAESRSGMPLSLGADIDGAPGTRLAIDLTRDGATIATRPVVVDAAGHARVMWTDTPQRPGVIFYHAMVMDPRLGIALSEAGAGVSVGGRGRVLIVTDRPSTVSRFRGADVDIDERTATTMPDSRSALAPYGAIILDAIAPHRLNARQQDALSDAVTLDGAGLLVLGDRESLNAAEFPASRFTDSLPIDFTTMPRPPAASMALALLVDTSGSMAATSDGVTKISAARDAVARALAVIPAGDAVEVIGFAAAPTVIVPAGDPRDAASVSERLRALTPGGGTALTPALAQAVAWLRGVSNPVRRILLVSDGRTTPADAASAESAVSGQGVEVSSVAIGGDADRNWLTGLARSTGGRAYFPGTLGELPHDVAREASRGAGGREIDERFRVRGGPHPLAPASPPELGGYVAGRLKPGASAAWKSPAEDPVMAAWPHGLGRVAVFASDVGGTWGAPMAGWSEAAAFWPRAMKWLSRATDAGGADAQLETTAAGTRLIVDTGSEIAGDMLPAISATIVTPAGATLSVPLHAVSSTRAEAALPLSETGDYRATIVIRDPSGGRDVRFMRGWFWSGDVEAQARGVNLPLLRDIAARSGGQVRAGGAAVGADEGIFDAPRTRSPWNAATALLLIAAALLFWDYSRALARERHR